MSEACQSFRLFDIFIFTMPTTTIIAVGAIFILCASSASCQDSEESPPVTIEPFRLTIEVGNDASFACHHLLPDNITHVSWFYPDNVTEVAPESNSTRIYVDTESQLHIRNAQENDTGLYLCKVTVVDSISTDPTVTFSTTLRGDTTVTHLPISNSTDAGVTDASNNVTVAGKIPDPRPVETETPETFNATVALNVYVMPTYFTEGMIILGINLGLLLVFLICLTQSLISERKRMQTYYKK